MYTVVSIQNAEYSEEIETQSEDRDVAITYWQQLVEAVMIEPDQLKQAGWVRIELREPGGFIRATINL